MLKIEKWRIQELARVLNQVSVLLLLGKNREWAQVFSHFEQESQGFLNAPEFDLGQFQNLLRNIKICFSESYTFRNTSLALEISEDQSGLQQELEHAQARLLKVLDELAGRSVELIH